MWMTDLETLLFVLGSGTSGVQGTALSLIHCSREDSVAFTVVSFVTRTVKATLLSTNISSADRRHWKITNH